jgi:glutaconate CoA-transferase subunit A
MRNAVAALVHDGDTVVIEGFTHLICFAAGHEIIRQRRRDLTLCRLTPDLIYDQMIAAGSARKLVFSWAGNPGAGSLHAFRRAVEKGDPPLELEEYSHFGMVARLCAGAARLPFWTLRDYMGTDLPVANPRIRTVTCPYTGEVLATVPALNPDVTVVHAQRADAQGNAIPCGGPSKMVQIGMSARSFARYSLISRSVFCFLIVSRISTWASIKGRFESSFRSTTRMM